MDYKKRSPDLAIVLRNLDFKISQEVLRRGQRIVIFTIDDLRWFATLTWRKQALALTTMLRS